MSAQDDKKDALKVKTEHSEGLKGIPEDIERHYDRTNRILLLYLQDAYIIYVYILLTLKTKQI